VSKKTRREFLQSAAYTSLALGVGPTLANLAGCDGVDAATGKYDVIIIGGGTSGAIVAAKLQAASRGNKRILIIEAGGPTSASIGGTHFPQWLPSDRKDLTIFDVPGEYSLNAFAPQGVPYQLTETPFTYQGIGLGGNSIFSGMLIQTNPSKTFDQSWPKGWAANDLATYYQRVRQKINVTNTPSTNELPQNTDAASIVHPLYKSKGWVETNTSVAFSESGAYSRPYVAIEDGKRAGPITGYFEEFVPGGVPVKGLEILEFTKVDRIEFDTNGKAVRIHYTKRGALDQSLPGVQGVANLNKNGFVVMAAGALATPRLLLLSGVGPRGRESEIFPEHDAPPFAIDNPQVGVGVYDHALTLVAFNYEGGKPYEAYDYGDFAKNESDLKSYLNDGSGPYAQYQPVSILNYRDKSEVPNVEVFINPNGVGPAGGRYYGKRTFAAYVMLLDPKSRGVIVIGKDGKVKSPEIYLTDDSSGNADIDVMSQAVFDLIQLFKKEPGMSIAFGPGSSSHPSLNPDSLEDIKKYVVDKSPVDGIYFSRLTVNHYGGTAPLTEGKGGVDPESLVLRGTKNVTVVDASLAPRMNAHPVATIMAIADRAGDILTTRLGLDSTFL
jgi:cellobiose dehydrogenase (acceptor)